MQLVAQKFNLQAFTQSKAFRFTNYALMLMSVIALYSVMNSALAINESDLGDNLGDTQEDAGDVTVAAGILGAPVNWLISFLSGTGGLLATVIALAFAVYSAIAAKSLAGVIICFGIALTAIYGPSILLAFFGAVI
jgi:hypothetical protein